MKRGLIRYCIMKNLSISRKLKMRILFILFISRRVLFYSFIYIPLILFFSNDGHIDAFTLLQLHYYASKYRTNISILVTSPEASQKSHNSNFQNTSIRRRRKQDPDGNRGTSLCLNRCADRLRTP